MNSPVIESLDDLNMSPGKRRYRSRKAKGLLEQRRSLGRRQHVMGDAKFGYRATRPETGQEPAYNRPAESDWEPQNESVRPACFSGEFVANLSGYSWLDIQSRAHWATKAEYDWRGQR